MLSGSVHFVAPSPTSPLLSPDYGVATASGEGVEHPGSGNVEWAVVQGIAGLCNPATVQGAAELHSIILHATAVPACC